MLRTNKITNDNSLIYPSLDTMARLCKPGGLVINSMTLEYTQVVHYESLRGVIQTGVLG